MATPPTHPSVHCVVAEVVRTGATSIEVIGKKCASFPALPVRRGDGGEDEDEELLAHHGTFSEPIVTENSQQPIPRQPSESYLRRSLGVPTRSPADAIAEHAIHRLKMELWHSLVVPHLGSALSRSVAEIHVRSNAGESEQSASRGRRDRHPESPIS